MLPFLRVHIACADNQCSTSTLAYEEHAQVSPIFALPQSDIHAFLLTRGRRGIASLFEANARSQMTTKSDAHIGSQALKESRGRSQINCCANLFVGV